MSKHSTTFLSGTRTKRRRNFLPTLIITFILWVSVGGLVYFIDPDTFMAVPVFFVLAFAGFLLTFSTILAHTRRGLIISLGLALFLLLRYFGTGNILNLFLILALCICAELYFNRLN